MRKIAITIVVWAIASMVLAAATEQPGWINNWSSYYPEDSYICAVGYGKSRSSADQDGLSQLAAFFGTSVSTHTTMSATSVSTSSENYSDDSYLNLFASGSTLSVNVSNMVGTSFRERWDNGEDYYSLAVIDRKKTKEYYYSQANNSANSIKQAFNMNMSEISFVNFYLVRNISDSLVKYDEAMRILSVVAPPLASLAEKIPARNEISALIEKLNYNAGVSVECNDEAWQYLSDDFYSVLSSHGISILDETSRFVISIKISIEPTNVLGNDLKFVSYSISVSIRDQVQNKNIFTWKSSGREGQLTYDAAEVRAIIAMRKKFSGDFDQKFSKAFNLV